MPSPTSFLVLIALLILILNPTTSLPLSAPENTCTLPPQPKTCTFYSDCLESTYQCGQDGYALGYGKRYCEAFGREVGRFSPKGQEWIYKTMLCLQNHLVPLLPPSPAQTCQQIKSFAFESHSVCYVQSGFCTLTLKDWAVLLDIVELKDLIDLKTVREGVQVAGQCGKEYVKKLVDLLDGKVGN